MRPAAGPGRSDRQSPAHQTSPRSRTVCTVEQAAWLIAARETHRFVLRLSELLHGVRGARRVTSTITAAAEAARAHPVCAKILRDDPDFIGRALTRRMPSTVDALAAMFRPFLESAMKLGVIRRHDASWLAGWIARVYVISVLAPPSGDGGASLEELLLPVLEPCGSDVAGVRPASPT